MGITSPLEANLSLALGTSVVSPLEMASAYGTIANQGIHVDPSPIRDNSYPQQTEVISAGTAYVMTSMLESVINEGTGYPNAIIGRPAAGKTGTASDYRDAWFVGFTPDLVTSVWIGNDDYHRMNESYGGNIPARIWARFMKAALAKTPKHDFLMPAGEVRRLRLCGTGRSEVFLAGTEPAHTCGDDLATPRPAGSPAPAVLVAPSAGLATPQAPRATPAAPNNPVTPRPDDDPESPAPAPEESP
jgi:penicillin-binding protein 1A